MSPEKQRIAIAETCGWMCIGGCCAADYAGWIRAGERNPDGMRKLPDYLNDLNAMHEAEKVLTVRQSEDYWDELASMVPRNQGMFSVLHTSASFRAAAFLRTARKWEEAP